MKQKNYLNNEYVIVVKLPEQEYWQTNLEKMTTPVTLTMAISTCNLQNVIKKVTWDFGNGNQQKSITNRKQNLHLHEIHCKYKKSNDSVINICASIQTEKGEIIPRPIVTTTVNTLLKEHYVEPEIFKNQILDYYKTNNFTNEVADSIYKIANRLAFAPNFINYCVDEKTEALTQRGWLKYNEINNNDKILSYDIITKHMIWSNIKNIYINKYNGLMHYLTNHGLDALVTPGHKFISKERGLIPVEDIKAKEHLILMGLPLKDTHTPIYSNDFVELIGWAVTKGNYLKGKHTHSVQIFQKIGPKADLIRNCLNRLNISFKEYKWSNPNILGFRFNKFYANQIIELAPNKALSMKFILSLTQKQRLLLIDTMIKGDGYIVDRKGTRQNTYGYSQKDKNHIDTFLALCTLSGITTSLSYVKNNTSFGKSEYYQIYFYNNPKTTCSSEHVDFHGGRPGPGGNLLIKKNPNVPTYKYNGIIWCPQTEYGTFICRREKYIYITGNSYREDMIGDAVVRMVEALTTQKFDPLKGNPFSYFTKIAFHAFCNRIKKEKRSHKTLTEYQNEIFGGEPGNDVSVYNSEHNSDSENY